MSIDQPDLPERFDLRSADPLAERIDVLRATFPEAFREGKVDIEVLTRSLGEWVDPGPERFGLTWPGKAECMRVIQEPSLGALVPMPEESVDWDTTQNVIIEGDNLEVLKLLQKAYYGKVKMIYIDPPYNTGKEFIYPDNFREGLADYLKYSGQLDDAGFRISANTETGGRHHSKWLSMMYPRLFLARNLLRSDGAIFLTIDDTEVANLRQIMDDIFGEENFVATIAWQKAFAKKNKALISGSHDHILVYARSLQLWDRNLLPREAAQELAFKNPDDDPRGPWQSVAFSVPSEGADRRDSYRYKIALPSGRTVDPPTGRHWNGNEDRFFLLLQDDRIWFGRDNDSLPRVKTFRSEVQDGIVPDTWWRQEDAGNNQDAKREVLELFGTEEPFSTPKPRKLLRRMINIATDDNDLILDFFAGSGSTADAVLHENDSSVRTRRYILVQLPEPIKTSSSRFNNICELTRERVRLAAKSLQAAPEKIRESLTDQGFRAFRLSTSNFNTWSSEPVPVEALGTQLELAAVNLVDTTALSAVYEIMVKAGFSLTTHVEILQLPNDTKAYAVDHGSLLVFLDNPLTLQALEEMISQAPSMLIIADAAFTGDELKVNALQTVRAHNRREETDLTLRIV